MPLVHEWVLANKIPGSKMKNIQIVCEQKEASDFSYLECQIFDSDRFQIGEFAIRHYSFDAEWNRPISYAGIKPYETHLEWADLDEG